MKRFLLFIFAVLIFITGCEGKNEDLSDLSELEDSIIYDNEITPITDFTLDTFLERNFSYFIKTKHAADALWIDDDHIVFLAAERNDSEDNYHYSINYHNIVTKENVILWEEASKYRPYLWLYSPKEHSILFYSSNGYSSKIYQLDLTTRKLTDIRWEQHGDWKIYYQPNGIWAENTAIPNGKKEQWTQDKSSCCIRLLKNNKEFVYLEETGKTFADGSGLESLLKKVNIETKEVKILFPERVHWKVLGWAVEGEILLVDESFNEGESINYTSPILVDLIGETIKPLNDVFREQGAFFDPVFNEKVGLFIANYDNQRFLFNIGGDLISKKSWNGEFQQHQTFSEDGNSIAYTSGTFSEGRIFISDVHGNNQRLITVDSMPVGDLMLSPSGKRVLVNIPYRILGLIDINN